MDTQEESRRAFIRLSVGGIAVATGLICVVLVATPLIHNMVARAGYLVSLPLDAQYFERIVLQAKLSLAREKHDADVWAFGDSSCLLGSTPLASSRPQDTAP